MPETNGIFSGARFEGARETDAEPVRIRDGEVTSP
jgi:hypothetical protein